MKFLKAMLLLFAMNVQRCAPRLAQNYRCQTILVSLCILLTSCVSGWNYRGSTGPKNWGDLDQKFKFCKIGNNQSPIDVKYEFEDSELSFSYKDSEIEKEREKFTIKINLFAKNTLTRTKKKYFAHYLRFHHPSEHLVKGKPYSIEMQITHKSDDEQLLNLAVFLEVGKINPEFNRLISFLLSDKRGGNFNLSKIIKTDDRIFFYDGSLTTPPCTEGVKWYIMQTPIEISSEQMNELISLTILSKSNARPVQNFYPSLF